MDKVEFEPFSGCWIWTGCLHPDGYGKLGSNARTEWAHRVSYEEHIGPIPDGLQLDHLCRVRCCVNPKHLEPVTLQENQRRGESGLKTGAMYRAMTHCRRGHPFDEKNTSHARNQRICRACKNASARRGRAERAAEETG